MRNIIICKINDFYIIEIPTFILKMNTVPLELIALSCEYLSSEEILYIIDDYKLISQENKYFIDKKFINKKRYEEIREKGIFKFREDLKLLDEKYPEKINWYYLSTNP